MLGTPEAVAVRFQGGDPRKTVERIARLYTTLCGSTGFACGLPGYVSMPVTVPANVAGVVLLQLHMSTAIAAVDGRDLRDAGTREVCIDCVLGNVGRTPRQDESDEFTSRFGAKLLQRGVRFASEQAPRLFSRSARSLPLLGGIIGGVADARETQQVARAARRAFLAKGADEIDA